MELANGYIAPAVISEYDDEKIHARMLARLPADIDKTAGGFAHDFTHPAALEEANLVLALNNTVQVFFPQWSYGRYLNKLASQDGLKRRQATYAEAVLTVTGAEDQVIPAGFLWSTASTRIAEGVHFETLEEVNLGKEKTAQVRVRCTQLGKVGNVPENSIKLMVQPMGGIAEITNVEPATGGSEIETDDELRARILEKDRMGEASFVGCDADYRRWAREVDGVGDVTVIPEWNGPGTVKLIVMDINGAPANESIRKNVYDHIMRDDNRAERLAPIGAILTVATTQALRITVTADVEYDDTDFTLEDIQETFKERLQAHFIVAKNENELKYSKVGAVLSETPGITDYAKLRINGATDNIPIDIDDYPDIESVTLTEAVV